MKRVISLLLAILMVTGMLTVFGVAAAAEGGTPTTTKYVVYEEDFDSMEARASSEEVLEALGWYVPSDKVEKNIAQYQIVNGALRVDTSFANAIQGVPDTFKSFVTVFSGDIMSIVRNGDFTVSYDLTYRSGTTNYNNYTAMIYNYTETDNEEHKEAYGIAAVRPCGSGFNGIYSPISAGLGTLEGWENESELAMNNANTKVAAGYPSLYSRIAASLGDTTYTDTAPLQGKNFLIDKTVRVRLEYDYTDGMRVFLNDVQVSELNKDIYVDDTNYSGLWSTFLDESKGAAIGLLTLPYVVADIDNIKVEAIQVGSEGIVNQLPELVISEMCVLGNKAQSHGEFIELYNPTNRTLDLRDYSIYEANYSAGTIDDIMTPDRMMYKFKSTGLGSLADHIDNTVSYSNEYYAHVNDLRALYDFVNLPAEGNHRYVFVNDTKYANTSGTVSADGLYRKVRYIETWNSIFHMGEDGWDTTIAPGECVILCIGSKSYALSYSQGVNGGLVSKNFNVNTMNFRSNYRKYGLSKDTKIIFVEVPSLLNDAPANDRVGGHRYYVTKTCYDESEGGGRIDYPSFYTYDARIDPYIVSYIDLSAPLFEGRATPSLHNNPDDANFGMAGWRLNTGLSAAYVYGVDASRDARCGTLYQNQHRTDTSNADVGMLSGPQEIIMKQMYKSNGASPALSITEVVPNTNNLAGEAKKAFTAMELTNTSSMEVNVYDYALVCTEKDNNCKAGMGFSYVLKMGAGNPVKRTDGNGSYFYFAEEHISNPETCVLMPGESIVVWFITEDTFTSYQRDAAFGFDHFRQYWVNQGNAQLGIKMSDGNYATKVIAVDANKSNVYNAGNNELNFELSVFESVVYGVAKANESVLSGEIYSSDVINVAIFGFVSCYYGLTYGPAVSAVTGTTYYGLMIFTMPANVSMRYVVGGAGIDGVSALASSVRVARYQHMRGKHAKYKSETPLPENERSIVVNCTYAPMEVSLGTLDGKEVLPVLSKLFVKETASGNVTYRYFDELRTNILTLQGAAIDTAGAKPVLRFDNAVSNSVYSSLVATYGDKVEIGTLIVKTDALGDRKTFTETDLQNAGIDYKKVANKLLYRSTDYTVLSASIEAEGNDTSYTAVGYMKVTLNDGSVMTYYSADTTTRSVKEVAIAAIGDVYDAKEGIYQYDSVDNTENVTNYSPYTTAVQQKLKSYAGL